jgi:hypothetical protein
MYPLGGTMRIWDIHPSQLCRSHLLGEHRELHGLWNILTLGLRGYRSHPETRRWEGKLAALFKRHESLVAEMRRRGFNHHSELDPGLATGLGIQEEYVASVARQIEILRVKGCDCSPGQALDGVEE